MIVQSLSDLPAIENRAIIINVSTKWVTTLALLSALRHAQMPVLVIDCESRDGSFEHFKVLMQRYSFDLLRAPLKPHGLTLDWIFGNIQAENVLLIDSDAEILNRVILEIMEDAMKDPRFFGAGFTHGPEWLTKTQTGLDHTRLGLYQERMWIPLCMLNTVKLRQALADGFSFIDRIQYNDLPQFPRLSKRLFNRFHNKKLANTRLRFLDPFRRTYYNSKPSYIHCDTGADIFQHLRYTLDYLFAGLPAHMHGKYVSHFHGVTRKVLDPKDFNSTSLDSIMDCIFTRLREEYGIAVSGD